MSVKEVWCLFSSKIIKDVSYLADINNVKNDVRRKCIETCGNRISRIILFGSYARGDFEEDSDIDIMVLVNCHKDELSSFREKASVIGSDVSLDNSVTVSLLVRDSDTFYGKIGFTPFYQNIEKEGVDI